MLYCSTEKIYLTLRVTHNGNTQEPNNVRFHRTMVVMYDFVCFGIFVTLATPC